MPKGRGRKGSECPRKRKHPATVETRIENEWFGSSSKSNLASFPSWRSISRTEPVSHTNTPLTISQPQASGIPEWHWFPPSGPYNPYNTNLPLPYTSLPHTGFSSPAGVPYTSLPPPGFSSPSLLSEPGLSLPVSAPYTLCKITGNVSVCYGCHNKYKKNAIPPDDMCIKHADWREYTPPGTDVPKSRYRNVYRAIISIRTVYG